MASPAETGPSPDVSIEMLSGGLKEAEYLRLASEHVFFDTQLYGPKNSPGTLAADMTAYLEGEAHDALLGLKPMTDRLGSPEIVQSLDIDEAAIVFVAKRKVDRAFAVPRELVEEKAGSAAESEDAYYDAKDATDFGIFLPHLRKQVEIARRLADHIGYGASPYDALLAEREPGVTSAELDKLFNPLAKAIPKMLGAVKPKKQVAPDVVRKPKRTYPHAKQLALGKILVENLGFDFDRGSIEFGRYTSTINFGSEDVRVFLERGDLDSSDFTSGVLAIMHEAAGHGKYKQAMPVEHFGTALGEVGSYGIDESQARIAENHVGRNQSFVEKYLYEQLKSTFGDAITFTPEQMYKWMNRVEPSLIRIDADEVTYTSHIIMRTELEKAMIEGTLDVADLPDAWNEKVKQYLCLDVPNDAQGVLQDGHWSWGEFGYFPTYTLGDIYAAQMIRAMKSDIQGLSEQLGRGDFEQFNEWLKDNVYAQANRLTGPELVRKVTGHELGVDALSAHLWSKIDSVNL